MSTMTLEYQAQQGSSGPRLLQCTASERSWLWRALQSLCLLVCKSFYRLKVYDAQNVPLTGGVLVASSHQSYLDPILVAVSLNRPMAFLANAYLFKYKPFGWLIRCLNAFPIQQGKGDRAAVAEAIARLEEGYALTVFPEGHRTPDGQIKPLQRGFALVARKAGVPIVPAVVDGAYQAWPRRRKIPGIHPVHVIFGKPINISGMDGQQMVAALDKALQELSAELRKRRRLSGWHEWYLVRGRKLEGGQDA